MVDLYSWYQCFLEFKLMTAFVGLLNYVTLQDHSALPSSMLSKQPRWTEYVILGRPSKSIYYPPYKASQGLCNKSERTAEHKSWVIRRCQTSILTMISSRELMCFVIFYTNLYLKLSVWYIQNQHSSVVMHHCLRRPTRWELLQICSRCKSGLRL